MFCCVINLQPVWNSRYCVFCIMIAFIAPFLCKCFSTVYMLFRIVSWCHIRMVDFFFLQHLVDVKKEMNEKFTDPSQVVLALYTHLHVIYWSWFCLKWYKNYSTLQKSSKFLQFPIQITLTGQGDLFNYECGMWTLLSRQVSGASFTSGRTFKHRTKHKIYDKSHEFVCCVIRKAVGLHITQHRRRHNLWLY